MAYKFNLFLLMILSFGSCKRGEDIGGTSFRTKTKRISGEWVVTKILTRDSMQAQKFKDEFLILNENGTGTWKLIWPDSFIYTENVRWNYTTRTSYSEKKEYILVYEENGASKAGILYHIRGLTERIMILETNEKEFYGNGSEHQIKTYCKL